MQQTKNYKRIAEQYTEDQYIDLLVSNSGHIQHRTPLLERACHYSWQVHNQQSHLPSSLNVALLLSLLSVDETTLIVCLLSDVRLRNPEFEQLITKEFGETVSAMVQGLIKLHGFKARQTTDKEQTERLRRMLLAMVDDVRVVLIKLAYRVQRLRELANVDRDTQIALASESLDIFAPIANRLGIGQLKWELEDLSFRYLQPDTYKRIAKLLEETRDGREEYIEKVVAEIRQLLSDASINAEVYGRPKHIYSIWNKMTHKHKNFDELFDVRAIRITVNTVAECYTALGLIHGHWRHIAKEFDDYIANTKENGYQSLHTAVYGPEGKAVEVQIRTHEMHAFAEYGVAAHWRYKERSAQDALLEKTITSVRKLLDPKETNEDELLENFKTDLFSDRVFVLTPQGTVVDLPQGATPLDFAYSVHTEIGHRCRGAKVNGRIVPLNSELANGVQVEILTTNTPEPSRDWLNPNLGYLKSNRARSKVKAWFRHQDYEQNVIDGKSIVDREFKRLNIHHADTAKLVKYFKLQTDEEFQAKIGRGDITGGQLSSACHLLFLEKEKPELSAVIKPRKTSSSRSDTGVVVNGVGNLLTTTASCCNPVPGDDIIGFITRGKGVSVHRKDCLNIINLEHAKKEHLIQVEWSDHNVNTYALALAIHAIDRTGLLRDVTNILSDQKVNVIGVQTQTDKENQTADMKIMVEVHDLQQLQKIMDKISQLSNVLTVCRDN